MAKQTNVRTRERAQMTFIEEARRRQILDAALKLFAERGYDQTSLADIAAACDVSKGVVSYHFEGKAQIGAEALRYILRGYADFVRQRLETKTSYRDKLLELPAACIDFMQQSPADYVTYLDTLGSFGNATERRQYLAKGYAGMRSLVVDLIVQGQKRKEVAAFPAQPVADILQAAIDGLTEQAAVAPREVDLEASKRTLQKIVAALVDGDIPLSRK